MRDISSLTPQELRLTEALQPFGIQINDGAWNAAIGALQIPVIANSKTWVYDKDGNGELHPTREANEMIASGDYFEEPEGYKKAEEARKAAEKEEDEIDWSTAKHADFKVDELVAYAKGFGLEVVEGATKAEMLAQIQAHLSEKE